MHRVAISSTGLYIPPDIITNDELVAAFKGQHGWYWKNRGRQQVTVVLSTAGQYASIKRVL